MSKFIDWLLLFTLLCVLFFVVFDRVTRKPEIIQLPPVTDTIYVTKCSATGMTLYTSNRLECSP